MNRREARRSLLQRLAAPRPRLPGYRTTIVIAAVLAGLIVVLGIVAATKLAIRSCGTTPAMNWIDR